MAGNDILYQWETAEEKKDPNTIFGVFIIAFLTIVAIGYNIYIKEWFAVVAFTLVLVVLAWYMSAKKKGARVIITGTGVQLNEQFYVFEKFKSYWVSEKNQTIYLIPKAKTGLSVSLPIGGASLAKIKESLPEILIETEKESEDFIDRITGFLHI